MANSPTPDFLATLAILATFLPDALELTSVGGDWYGWPSPREASMYTRLIPAPAEDSAAVTWDDAACPLCGTADAETVLEAPDPTPAGGPGEKPKAG